MKLEYGAQSPIDMSDRRRPTRPRSFPALPRPPERGWTSSFLLPGA